MSSFSCPHIRIEDNYCIKLKVECIPGSKGCVLARKYQFAFSPEDRVKIRENIKLKKK